MALSRLSCRWVMRPSLQQPREVASAICTTSPTRGSRMVVGSFLFKVALCFSRRAARYSDFQVCQKWFTKFCPLRQASKRVSARDFRVPAAIRIHTYTPSIPFSVCTHCPLNHTTLPRTHREWYRWAQQKWKDTDKAERRDVLGEMDPWTKADRRDGRAALAFAGNFHKLWFEELSVFHQPPVWKVIVLHAVPTHSCPSLVKQKEPLMDMDANASHLRTSAARRAWQAVFYTINSFAETKSSSMSITKEHRTCSWKELDKSSTVKSC